MEQKSENMTHKRIRQWEITRNKNPPELCTKKDCNKKHQAKGLCKYHYQILIRTKYTGQLLTSYGFTIEGNRLALLNMLGAECIKCGYSDLRALQLDHINGGGCKERKKTHNQTLIRFYRNNPKEAFKKLQVLCANCNWIKLAEERQKGIEV